MEHLLLAEFEKTAEICSSGDYTTRRPLSLQSLCTAHSLISNPFTSHTTLHSLLKTLARSLHNNQDSDSVYHGHILSLLSVLFRCQPDLRHDISLAVRAFVLSPSTPTSLLVRSLSIVFNCADIMDGFVDESMFLSLCFRPCKASVQLWLLRNVNRFFVRPSVLVTVLLGFTKDPYPFARKAALDGLASLPKFLAFDDQTVIQGCYFRSVELLFDLEDSVRCSAVRAVSEWGQLIVASNQLTHKSDWSDALFVQLCSVLRDTSTKVRIEAFDALVCARIVSEDILLQTLSKKPSLVVQNKIYPGQHSSDLFELPASTAAFAFVHGLEDECYEVRRSACRALGILSILSADFAFEAVNLFMDMLNDSLPVRFQALEAMHQMATSGNLRVQCGHLHMLLGTLVDCNSSVRAAARRVLHLTRLDNLAMFTLCFEGLVKNLKMYPQDEPEIFCALFNVGQHHGKFVAHTIQKASDEIEPSFGGKLGYENARTITLLVLSITAPVSLEQSICSIPANIFSYAATLLGRISHGLAGNLSINDLLSYLCYCSRFTYVSISEFFDGEDPAFPVVKGNTQLWQKSYEFHQSQFEEILKLKKGAQLVSHQLKIHEAARMSLKIMLQQVERIWISIQCGCLDEVTRTLRSWKNELKTFLSDSPQPIDDLDFTLQYLKTLKLLGRIWIKCMFPGMMIHTSAVGELRILFIKLDRSMRHMKYRFLGLNKETELHILELTIVSYALKISNAKVDCLAAAMEKLYSTVSCVERLHKESTLELSSFIVELQKILRENSPPTDGAAGMPVQLHKSLEHFSLKQFELSGILLKYVKADLEVFNNSCENPLNFIFGLPVGIPIEIKLYNVSCESRLWLKMTLGGGRKIQYVFLDLDGVSSYDEIKKFTFVAPFYGIPKVRHFTLSVCVAMECSPEHVSIRNNYGGPKHELIDLCRNIEVYFSRLDN